MSIISVKSFINNQIPIIFNKDLFNSSGIISDNINTLSLNVSGSSYLNTLNTTGNISSININNSSLITSGSITNNGALTTNSLSSSSVSNSGTLTSNTITCTNLLTASNGLTVSSGTVSAPANSIALAAVNNLSDDYQNLII
jgi:hypothetical protein